MEGSVKGMADLVLNNWDGKGLEIWGSGSEGKCNVAHLSFANVITEGWQMQKRSALLSGRDFLNFFKIESYEGDHRGKLDVFSKILKNVREDVVIFFTDALMWCGMTA